MNKLKHCLAALLLFVGALAQAAMAGDLKVVHSGNWPPYTGEDLPEQGLAIDLVTTALKRAGYNPRSASIHWSGYWKAVKAASTSIHAGRHG